MPLTLIVLFSISVVLLNPTLCKEKYFIDTVFIQLSAGVYLIFGLSGRALIQDGRLFEAERFLNFHHFHFT